MMDLKFWLGPTFSMISSNTCSNVLVWNLAYISVIGWSFSKIFLLKIGLISIYKMPPVLPCYLIRVLRYSSGNIQKIGILADTWKSPHYVCMKHHGIFFPILFIKNYTILCILMREKQWCGLFCCILYITRNTWGFSLKFSKNSRCLPPVHFHLLPQISALRLHEKFQYFTI